MPARTAALTTGTGPLTSRVVCLILGGGRGTRLYPLTKSRSKPAVPIGGKYRLIDIPISNCIYSGLNRMFVLTQFNSDSLHRHIANTYRFDAFGGGFVEILAAQQTMQSETWYQGTADAVRQNIPHFDADDHDLVLILSGDQLYRMDFRDMIRTHRENGAEATIAALPVDEAEARACGIMRIQPNGRVIDFEEKPKTEEALARVRTEPEWLESHGIAARGRSYLASMGIYLFNRATLLDLLTGDGSTDFGKGVFPKAINQNRVFIHPFDGYWEDIGTIGAFHRANIDLTKPDPPFEFTANNQNIFTRPRYMSCSRVSGATITDSLIADGATIGRGTVIENSIVGIRSQIGDNVTIKNSYVMGLDLYESQRRRDANQAANRPHMGIGAGSHIENAIIDKNARIGRNVKLINKANVVEGETPYCVIRDSVIVVPKFSIVPDLITI